MLQPHALFGVTQVASKKKSLNEMTHGKSTVNETLCHQLFLSTLVHLLLEEHETYASM